MKEPKGSGLLLLLAIVAVINAAPLPGRNEEKLPHSRDYYDGYVRALVDHYDEIYRSQRDLTPKDENKGDSTKETAVAEGVTETAAKKDEIKDANGEANEAIQANQTAESQANGQNDTTSDQPYMNPEQTGKPPVTDTKQEEAPVPDAHKLNENEKTSGASESLKDVKENMFKAEDTTNLPETMQDIKFYTGKSKEFEDMKRKRSTENEAPVIQPATAPAAKSNIAPVSQSLAAPATQVAAQPQQLATVAAQVVPQQPMSPIKAAEAQVNSDKRNQAKPDMNSESKIISHSSSTYTPGDPNKNPPVVPNNDKDPNKEEPYEKEIIPEEESGDAEASGDDEDSEGESDVEDDKKVEVNKKSEKKSEAEESMETEKKDESPEDESDNDDSDIKEDEAADKTEDDNNSDDDDADEETSSEERQSVVPMLLVPIAMDDSRDMGAMFASAGERKDNVGKKRQAKKEEKKDDKKKDDKKDDDDDEHEHAYLAPLCGYPGWYEAGHGIPYGYGTNMLHGCGHHEIGHHGYGHHGHHGYGHHTFGDHDIIGYGLGHHGGYGMGHHGYGHHGIGHHGYGHGHGGYHLLDIHGYGGHHGHGYGHHGHGLHLDNGVIMPYGGGAMFFHSPCGCHSGGLASEMSMGLPF
eukprot:Seg1234.8 transcript_id=Seg1234.8/GoldUCD/mRNA.D3Y31 product="hypothetical protein" protein_id=Seg1234.8/GoldUCD/D3Y31